MNVVIDGASGAFITDQTATFTAVRYNKARGADAFNLGDGWGRTVAAKRVLKACLDDEGLFLAFTDGYHALVPMAALRPSWRILARP